ncbi:MAG: hypothetical protein GX270_03800 [Clostridiaceae bacterium]|jgi:hypothetical protein|nr:hypothetical protein [Clostridiaceae bacterium]
MTSNLLKKRFVEVFSDSHRSDLQTRLNTFIFYLKKGNLDELNEVLSKVNKEVIINKILETDKDMLKKNCVNISELRRRLTESDFEKILHITGQKGDIVVIKIKELINW